MSDRQEAIARVRHATGAPITEAAQILERFHGNEARAIQVLREPADARPGWVERAALRAEAGTVVVIETGDYEQRGVYAVAPNLDAAIAWVKAFMASDITWREPVAWEHSWSTTLQTKHLMISWLLRFVVDNGLTIHSSTLYNELCNYVTLPNGGYGPSDEKNGFDDCVMAMAQAVVCNVMEPVLMAYGEGPIEGSLVLPGSHTPTMPDVTMPEPIPAWEHDSFHEA